MHAHPDDESLTTGGTIARYSAEGAEVTVATCTLGEEGEIIPAELRQLGSSAADQLGGYRVGELTGACRALGVGEHRYLGCTGRWRDSGMAGTPSAEHPRAFAAGAYAEQVAALRAIVDELSPQVVVSYDPSGGYGHPDHIRAHEIATAMAEAPSVRRIFHTVASRSAIEHGVAALRSTHTPFQLPSAGQLPSVPDERITTTIELGPHVAAKVAALRAHRTQISVPESGHCLALSNGIAQPILRQEYFELVRGPTAGARSDLFGGLDD